MTITALSVTKACQKIGFSRAYFYAKQNPNDSRYDKSFPKPISITPKRKAWLEHELDQWLDARIAERDTARKGA